MPRNHNAREIQIKQGIRTRCTRTNGHSWQCGNVRMTDSRFCEHHKAGVARKHTVANCAPMERMVADGESETEQKAAQGILNGTLIVKDVVYLEQGVPKREASAVKLLAPWMGILVNIDNSRKTLAGLKWHLGLQEEIKEKFKEYNPETVYVFHDLSRQHDTALLAFKNDMQGLEDAEAFQRSFAAYGRGRKEWLNDWPANLDLYGWQATEKDLTADLGQLKQHLKRFCQSKSVRDVFEEEERKTRETVATLVKTIEIVITSKRSSTQ